MVTEINAFFEGLKTFDPTTEIKSYSKGFADVSLIYPQLEFVIDKGSLNKSSFQSSLVTVETWIYISIKNDLVIQDKLLMYVQEMNDFLKLNPRLGGIQKIEFYDFDVAINNKVQEGLLTLNIRLTIQEN